MAGALPAYDLPDLVAALAPRPVLMVDPRDALARPASPESVAEAYDPPSAALRVAYTGLWESAWEGIPGWLDETAPPAP